MSKESQTVLVVAVNPQTARSPTRTRSSVSKTGVDRLQVRSPGCGCCISPRLTSLAPQPPHKAASACRFAWSGGSDHIPRNEGVAYWLRQSVGPNPVSSTIRPGQGDFLAAHRLADRRSRWASAPQVAHRIPSVTARLSVRRGQGTVSCSEPSPTPTDSSRPSVQSRSCSKSRGPSTTHDHSETPSSWPAANSQYQPTRNRPLSATCRADVARA